MSDAELPPPPLTPPDCDLRSHDWFALKFRRLRDSDFWLDASDRVKVISLELWGQAYEQVPAGSLPARDERLAELCGYGRLMIDQWREIKPDVMKAWVLCSDGRWYHPTLCIVALEAYILKLKDRARKGNGGGAKERLVEVQQMLDRLTSEYIVPVESADISMENPPNSTGNDIGQGQGHRHRQKRESRALRARPELALIPEEDVPRETPKPASARATRIPDDWTLTGERLEAARREGLTTEIAEREALKFADYWKAKGGANARKVDWEATWRNWIRRAAEGSGSGQRGRGSVVDDINDLRAIARGGG